MQKSLALTCHGAYISITGRDEAFGTKDRTMTEQATANRITIISGSRRVISFRNGEGYSWNSRLYVSHGETATPISAMHKTVAGVRKWAAKVLTA